MTSDFTADNIGTMITPPNPTPEGILALLQVPLVAFRESLDSAVSFADTVMSGLPSCSYTWAALARYWAWIEVDKRVKFPESRWKAARLSNNGMEMRLDGYTVRPLKSASAGPPNPGRSLSRQDYYTQFAWESLPGLDVPSGANLILDWTVTKKREPLLALSMPEGRWKYRSEPKLKWRRVIDFGAFGGGEPLSFTPPNDTGDAEFYFRIDKSEFDNGTGESAEQ